MQGILNCRYSTSEIIVYNYYINLVQVLGMWGRLQEIKTLVLSGQLKRYVW